MSGVVGSDSPSVVAALQDYALAKQGTFSEESLTAEDEECLVISEGIGGVSVLYPSSFFEWDDASEFMSKKLGRPVFSFHIHDGDLWMYVLYDKGTKVDQFNPIPDYWKKTNDANRRAWAGNAAEVANRVPGLSPGSIVKYLVSWDDSVIGTSTRSKAYPDDQFDYGSDWQLVDFMKRIGLDYPVGDDGSPHGETYRFTCESDE